MTDERKDALYRVAERGVDLARGGAGSMGYCAREAARVEGVTLTADELNRMLLVIVRTSLALDGLA